ncbi:MAG: hypothetical protein IJO99_03135 [Ruminococcus sp.]|nr:hypothetical protein [Ruminococcus sp.]
MKKKFAVLTIFTALALTALASCSDKDEPSSSIDEAIIKQPVTFSYDTGDDEEEEDVLDAQDPTSAGDSGNSEPATEYVPVTEPDGEPVTTYIPVTDAQGTTVTETDGAVQTTAVTVTTCITVDKNTETTTATGDSYKEKRDDAYAMWLDISTEEDFHFQGDFIQVKFKIKETAPDGVYDVNITNPDFATFANNISSVYPDTLLHGKVYVNETLEPQREVVAADGFTVYADNVAGKQGDEVTITFSMNQNPGMCALNFWFDYDKNAMQIVECSAVGEFADIASVTSFGEPKNQD